MFCLSFFLLYKISTFPLHVLFATDEVEFQENGKFRLVCASRCSEEVYIGLDFDTTPPPKKMPAVLVTTTIVFNYLIVLIYSCLFSSTAFQEYCPFWSLLSLWILMAWWLSQSVMDIIFLMSFNKWMAAILHWLFIVRGMFTEDPAVLLP